MEKLSFNVLQVLEETKDFGERFINPCFETFLELEKEFTEEIDGVYYEIQTELDKNYIWLSFDYGKANPRDEKLTNIITGKKRKNNRKPIEAELIQQFFCLYMFSKNMFFISNSKKKNILKMVLKNKINKTFCLKTIQKTKEEFIEILSKVNSISFTEAKNLFSHNSKKRQALIDLTGTDAPEEFSIHAEYDKKLMQNFIKELYREKDGYKELIITGIDENDFEVVYNNDTFNKRIEIKVDRETNGKYISESVKEELLKEVNEKF